MTTVDSPVPGSEKPETAPPPQSIPTELGNDFNPLNDAVNEKPYSKPNISPTQEQLTRPIGQPNFDAPPQMGSSNAYDDLSGNNSNSGGGGGTKQAKQAAPAAINPAMENASDEEKKLGAKQLAKMIIDGYDWAHEIANSQLKFSERKITKLQADGEIDLAVAIPYDMDKVINAGDFIRNHNEMVQNALEVTPKFKKEVTPVLERVLEKRGAGLTDEQTLIYLFGRDIAVKSVQFIGLKRNMSDMIDIMKQYTELLREQGRTTPGVRVQAHTPPSPPYNGGDQPGYAQPPVYQEPEEKGTSTPMAPYEGNVPGAPEFGNKETLSHMEVVKKNEKADNYFKKQREAGTKNSRKGKEKIEDAEIISDEENPLT